MRIPLLLLILAPFWLTGCAGTRVKDARTGRTKFYTQADASSIDYQDGGTHLVMKDVKHSTATKAGGDAFAKGAQSVGAAGATLGLPSFLGKIVP